jgi:hypothetical protein
MNEITITPCANGFILALPADNRMELPFDVDDLLGKIRDFKADPVMDKIADIERNIEKEEQQLKMKKQANVFIFLTMKEVLAFLSNHYDQS